MLLAVKAMVLLQAAAAGLAPWGLRAVKPEAVLGGKIAVAEWKKAENKSTCAPVAFAFTGSAGEGAAPRRANFSGGWAVAFDQPNKRSAFGIAGAGVEGSDEDTARWPHQKQYPDGSSAGWGLEGDTGPGWLGYVHIASQGCLYNIWSNLGRAHLEFLLGQIRYVETAVASKKA